METLLGKTEVIRTWDLRYYEQILEIFLTSNFSEIQKNCEET